MREEKTTMRMIEEESNIIKIIITITNRIIAKGGMDKTIKIKIKEENMKKLIVTMHISKEIIREKYIKT